MESDQPPKAVRPPLTAKDVLLYGINPPPAQDLPPWQTYKPPTPINFKGEPCIPIKKADQNMLSTRFHFTLVGKFSYGRPPMEKLRKAFQTIGFKGECHIGLLDNKHVLLRFGLADDFHRCWLKSSWYLGGFNMKVLKWTPTFSIEEEPSIVPVWISLPLLPIFLYTTNCLKSIGDLLGTFLKMDTATQMMNRPSMARICVEIDLLKHLPDRIRIGDEEQGFWQEILYEDLPEYCTKCRKFGHSDEYCHPGALINKR